MTDAILVLNAGSSSIKFAIYAHTNVRSPALMSGKVINLSHTPQFLANGVDGRPLPQKNMMTFDETTTHENIVSWLLGWVEHENQGYTIRCVGHRVVHGGRDYAKPILLTTSIISQLKALVPLAPLHQPHSLSAIAAVSKWAPKLPQVACFDTSYHYTQEPLARFFALPREWYDRGIIRYGFHGLSYQYIANSLPCYLGELAEGRVIVAHLGNGASMCAMKKRQSVATSMGFTALDGLMMGQRCGSLDPGVVVHLVRHYKMSIEEIEHMLYNDSGLLGVSGISNNMQVLQNSSHPHAKQAIELFCYKAVQELSSLVSTINGIDAIVFTAGIGENSAQIRQQICDRLTWLGVSLDTGANTTHQHVISHPDSLVKVLIIPTNEELIIAQETQSLITTQ
ncbi:acetate/propionate family kinase [Brumicola nitratireducens]|uniref:Acetate kinase n=1 Tax=Glaciecola nitratireducens (strain JCM 12485 / KCTC 12276 / FR1064) TaxID=1085623 RepID=G4QN88_GLANF|nr:acetate/propionate family kinase [Glaciecola nitratireducens]AEP31507.1 acetate kinase [Glaciecola nitratireducens FR1064]